MYSDDNVRDQVTCRRNDRDTSLPKLDMNTVIKESTRRVTN